MHLPLLALLFTSLIVAGCTDSHSAGDASADTSPGPADYAACEMTSDCVVTWTTCCQGCARWTIDDVVAVNASRRMDYFDEVACPEGPLGCPRCAAIPNPSLVATCNAGVCEVVDLENDPALSGCASDEDCSLRVPDCCECGADTGILNLVALNAEGMRRIGEISCDPVATCAGCAPIYPPEAGAACHPDLMLCRVTETRSEP